jgi:hypothetical protein
MLPDSEGRIHAAEEVPFVIPAEDEEPTKPHSIAKAMETLSRESSLTVRNLTKAEAAQLAAIVAGWEAASQAERSQLEELARLAGQNRAAQGNRRSS